MRKVFSRLLLIVAVFSMVSLPVLADLTGDVQGTVVDGTGAPVVGAKVTITSLATGAAREVTTGSAGEFSVPQLGIGDYRISVEKDGFRGFNQDLVVRSGEKTRVDVALQLGKVTETVTV